MLLPPSRVPCLENLAVWDTPKRRVTESGKEVEMTSSQDLPPLSTHAVQRWVKPHQLPAPEPYKPTGDSPKKAGAESL